MHHQAVKPLPSCAICTRTDRPVSSVGICKPCDSWERYHVGRIRELRVTPARYWREYLERHDLATERAKVMIDRTMIGRGPGLRRVK